MDSSSTSVIDDRPREIGVANARRPTALDARLGAKRVIDLFGAMTFLVLFSPLMLGVALLILIAQGRPVLYGHIRVGKGGRSFKCYKFRTMVSDGERVLASHLGENPIARREWESTRKLRDDPRVTPLGRTLRKLSVDELPQFINVLVGEMSLVGPRPIVDSEVRHYGPHADAYFSVRPGLTGVWQVSGRSNVSYEGRVRMDVDYVDSWSLTKDLRILAKTLPAILSSDGSC
jgi:exopolysaccharide production protein ExoY